MQWIHAFMITLSMPDTQANEHLKCITSKVLISFSFLDKVGIHPPYLLKDYSSKHIPQAQRTVPLDLTSPPCFSQALKMHYYCNDDGFSSGWLYSYPIANVCVKNVQFCIISCFVELIIMASLEPTAVAGVWCYKGMNNSQKQNSMTFSETTRA